MSRLTVSIRSQDFARSMERSDLDLEVTSYSWESMGGPKECSITVWGAADALWQILSWLRCEVVVYDSRIEPVWWGYIDSLEIRVGAVGLGISLDTMANSIQCNYEAKNDGQSETGTKMRTSAATNADSIAVYGTKELRISSTSGNQAGAESERDALLAFRKYPIPTISPTDAASLSATIHCKGWWQTLAWRYYANAAGNVKNPKAGGHFQPIGNDTGPDQDNLKAAQSFVPDKTWTANGLSFRARKQGTPTDNLVVDLRADNAGVPGTVLATVNVAGASIPSNVEWLTVNITATTLTSGTTYWIQFSRDGSTSVSDYFQVDVEEDMLYTTGIFRAYKGGTSTWAARSPDCDLTFQVVGNLETTQQLADILGSTAGQFFTGTIIQNTSNVFTTQYRDGESLASDEAKKLLEIGNSAGGRVLARVNVDRSVTLYNEPASTVVPYRLMADGQLVDNQGQQLLNHTCPVAFWAELGDVIPASAPTNLIASPSPIFIESTSYNPSSKTLSLTPRAQEAPYTVGKVDEG